MLKLTMIGHLGNDAEIRDVNGQKCISFSLAHTERFTNRQGVQEERTTWVNCAMWRQDGKTGVAEFLKKGKHVYVEGIPSARAYTTRDGQNAAMLDLRVMTLELLGGRDNGKDQVRAREEAPQNHHTPEPPADELYDDGLPF